MEESDDVIFNEPSEDPITDRPYTSRVLFGIHFGKQKNPGMTDILKRFHIVKTNVQAYYVLMGLAIVGFLITFAIIYFYFFSPQAKKAPAPHIPNWIHNQIHDQEK